MLVHELSVYLEKASAFVFRSNGIRDESSNIIVMLPAGEQLPIYTATCRPRAGSKYLQAHALNVRYKRFSSSP